MIIQSLPGSPLLLDGGAMFGNAPKALWSRWLTPDTENRIPLTTRSLLLRDGSRTILFEAGMGLWMPPELAPRYGITEPGHPLLDELFRRRIHPEDITDIVLSHLHFDHSGGLLMPYATERPPSLAFPGATVWVSDTQWERACSPHPRDRASFLPALNKLLEQSGNLQMVAEHTSIKTDHSDICFRFSDGHTPGMICADISWEEGRIISCGDVIPGTPWVRPSITMGYDRFPEILINEKTSLLEDVADTDTWLFYTHDAETAASRVIRTERGFKPSFQTPEMSITL